MLWLSRRSVVAILKLLIPKSLFNTNSLLFFGSMDFDSLKLYGAIFISDGAVNALYHASKQYYHNAIAYKCKDLKIRRVWHCLILTLSYLKTKFLQHTSPGSKETYIGLVGARSQPGLVTTDHRLFYTWMLFTQASLLGRCFCQSALVLHYTTKYHHRTMQLYNCTFLRQFTQFYVTYFSLLVLPM